MSLSLPAELTKGDVVRSASTPSEYWTLVFQGFSTAQAGEGDGEEDLSPQQKAALTRAANKAKVEDDTSSQSVDKDAGNQAGDANES